ncbi:MAG: hypothetical protein ACE5J7_02265 [Candidatus Aenigmatarchaeota archaeon]
MKYSKIIRRPIKDHTKIRDYTKVKSAASAPRVKKKRKRRRKNDYRPTNELYEILKERPMTSEELRAAGYRASDLYNLPDVSRWGVCLEKPVFYIPGQNEEKTSSEKEVERRIIEFIKTKDYEDTALSLINSANYFDKDFFAMLDFLQRFDVGIEGKGGKRIRFWDEFTFYKVLSGLYENKKLEEVEWLKEKLPLIEESKISPLTLLDLQLADAYDLVSIGLLSPANTEMPLYQYSICGYLDVWFERNNVNWSKLLGDEIFELKPEQLKWLEEQGLAERYKKHKELGKLTVYGREVLEYLTNCTCLPGENRAKQMEEIAERFVKSAEDVGNDIKDKGKRIFYQMKAKEAFMKATELHADENRGIKTKSTNDHIVPEEKELFETYERLEAKRNEVQNQIISEAHDVLQDPQKTGEAIKDYKDACIFARVFNYNVPRNINRNISCNSFVERSTEILTEEFYDLKKKIRRTKKPGKTIKESEKPRRIVMEKVNFLNKLTHTHSDLEETYISYAAVFKKYEEIEEEIERRQQRELEEKERERVLEYIMKHKDGVTPAAAAGELNMKEEDVHRYVKELEEEGFIEIDDIIDLCYYPIDKRSLTEKLLDERL